MTNFNVNGFLETLQQNLPKEKDPSSARSLERIYLSAPDNYGKYQIFPMNSVVTNYPFAYLNDTREVRLQRKSVDAEGKEVTTEVWGKILPNNAYQMLDQSGRLVSSLTVEDEALLAQARELFGLLWKELDGGSKVRSDDKTVGVLRKKNYTVFLGKCIAKWNLNNQRNPEKELFSALFVCTAKGFQQALADNIENCKIARGGAYDWLGQVYNRDLTNREGYIIFSICMPEGKVGYNVSITHETDKGQYLKTYTISPEEEQLMQDPVEAFLGSQRGKEPGRLFNPAVMKEIIQTLSEKLAAVRMAKSTGMDVVAAAKSTSASAMMGQTGIQATNDPVLREQLAIVNSQQGVTNPEAIYTQNTNPYSTPPAAQIDPVSQNPIPPQQQAPYTQPSFAQGFTVPGFGQQPTQAPSTNPFGAPQTNANNPFQR